MIIKYIICDVVFKLTKNSDYKKGLGIYHLKEGETDINYTNTRCTVIPLHNILKSAAPVTYSFPFQLYAVKPLNDRIGNRITLTHNISVEELQKVTDEIKSEAGEE